MFSVENYFKGPVQWGPLVRKKGGPGEEVGVGWKRAHGFSSSSTSVSFSSVFKGKRLDQEAGMPGEPGWLIWGSGTGTRRPR